MSGFRRALKRGVARLAWKTSSKAALPDLSILGSAPKATASRIQPVVPAPTVFTPHNYNDLDIELAQIRVFELLPGTGPDPIIGKLFTYSLHKDHQSSNHNREFEALSYEWGAKSKMKPITLDDEEFQVTPNLFKALQFLRLAGCSRTLWIDAICINQRNDKEKESQIPLMSRIYCSASLVRVWIDAEVNLNDPAFKKLLRLTKESLVDDLGKDSLFWYPVRDTLTLSYWKRVWIQQEVLLARHFEVHCRQSVIPGEQLAIFQELLKNRGWVNDTQDLEWTTLYLACCHSPATKLDEWKAKAFEAKDDDAADQEFPSDPTARRDVQKYVPQQCYDEGSLLYCLFMCRDLQVTDPRDRIYGYLGLIQDFRPGDIDVDYSLPVIPSFVAAARYALQKYNSLDFLAWSGGSTEVKDCPTWLPHWWDAEHINSLAPRECRAAGTLPPLPDCISADGTLLIARGILIDSIFAPNSHDYVFDQTIPQFVEYLSFVIKVVLLGGRRGQDQLELFMGFIAALVHPKYDNEVTPEMLAIGGTIADQLLPLLASQGHWIDHPDDRASLLTEIRATLAEVLYIQATPLMKNYLAVPIWQLLAGASANLLAPAAVLDFVKAARPLFSTFAGNALAITAQKRFALVPDGVALKGDQIWILFGCCVPLILRPMGGYYVVVGSVALIGFMDGEAVQGIEEDAPDGTKVGRYQVSKIHLR